MPSELSSLEEEVDGSGPWMRIEELCASLTQQTRVRQKTDVLDAIARHIAAATISPPPYVYSMLATSFRRCFDSVPERHRPGLQPPASRIIFAFEQIMHPIPQPIRGEIENLFSTAHPPPTRLPDSLSQEESLELDFTIPYKRPATDDDMFLRQKRNEPDPEPSPKIRRIDIEPPVVLQQRGRPSKRATHGGLRGTMWDSPSIRKHLRIEDVQALIKLRDSVGQYEGLNEAVPSLQAKAEPCALISKLPVPDLRSWSSENSDCICSLCGLILNNQSAKRTHIKYHFLRASHLIHQLMATGKSGTVAPVTCPIRPLLEMQDLGQQGTSRARLSATMAALEQILPNVNIKDLAPIVRKILCERNNRDLQNIPLNARVNLAAASHCNLFCIICQQSLTPVFEQGQWDVANCVLCQISHDGSLLRICANNCGTQPMQTNGSLKDIDFVAAGPPGSILRRSFGQTYTASRDVKRSAANGLSVFLARLLQAVDCKPSLIRAILKSFDADLSARDAEGDALRAFAHALERIAEALETPMSSSDMEEINSCLLNLVEVNIEPSVGQGLLMTHGPQFLAHASCATVELAKLGNIRSSPSDSMQETWVAS